MTGRRVAVGAALAATLLSGCGFSEEKAGPLAVVERDRGLAPEALLEGALRIEGGCVDVVHDTQEIGLVFYSTIDPAWDDAEQTVSLTDTEGDPITFRDGDQVSFGGGGSSADEGSPTEAYYAGEETGWLAKPPARCERDTRFEVATVQAANSR